jgi:hypothetical protein
MSDQEKKIRITMADVANVKMTDESSVNVGKTVPRVLTSVNTPPPSKKSLAYLMAALIGLVFIVIIGLAMHGLHNSLFPQTQAGFITKALREDAEWGRDYESRKAHLTSKGDNYCDDIAQLISNLVTHMRNIDISNCPPDFQEAYRSHIQCWSNFGETFADHPHLTRDGEGVISELIIAAIGGDTSDMLGYASDVTQQNNAFMDLVREGYQPVGTSWSNVQNVAERYGVHPVDYTSN